MASHSARFAQRRRHYACNDAFCSAIGRIRLQYRSSEGAGWAKMGSRSGHPSWAARCQCGRSYSVVSWWVRWEPWPSWRCSRFSGNARFAGARFSRDAGFDGTQFSSGVEFRSALFSGYTVFDMEQAPAVTDFYDARARPLGDDAHLWPATWTTREAGEGDEGGWLYLIRLDEQGEWCSEPKFDAHL
jgi:hypothetical protein